MAPDDHRNIGSHLREDGLGVTETAWLLRKMRTFIWIGRAGVAIYLGAVVMTFTITSQNWQSLSMLMLGLGVGVSVLSAWACGEISRRVVSNYQAAQAGWPSRSNL